MSGQTYYLVTVHAAAAEAGAEPLKLAEERILAFTAGEALVVVLARASYFGRTGALVASSVPVKPL